MTDHSRDGDHVSGHGQGAARGAEDNTISRQALNQIQLNDWKISWMSRWVLLKSFNFQLKEQWHSIELLQQLVISHYG
jgi:hypothetical protein